MNSENYEPWIRALANVNADVARRYPGPAASRQPVHTVYGGAHLFKSGTSRRIGAIAIAALDRYGAPEGITDAVEERVRRKLSTEPVEDYRIDFEDGYGFRPPEEEDADAIRCASELDAGSRSGSLPPFIGFRPRCLGEETKLQALRTVELLLTNLCRTGVLPAGFRMTLPKVTTPVHAQVFAAFLDAMEQRLGLDPFSLRFEVMIETPQALLVLHEIVEAADGRCCGAHFGPYDYTSALGITSTTETVLHPACDFARHQMQAAYAALPIFLSDGPTNVFPVPVHRGETLTGEQEAENRAAVHHAWSVHMRHIQRSMENGFYQSWDLHPAQLVSRYCAVFRFYHERLGSAGARLKNFVEEATRATMAGGVFDDAASAQSLLNFFARAVDCGAVDETEVSSRTGLTLELIRSRSFPEILRLRAVRP